MVGRDREVLGGRKRERNGYLRIIIILTDNSLMFTYAQHNHLHTYEYNFDLLF